MPYPASFYHLPRISFKMERPIILTCYTVLLWTLIITSHFSTAVANRGAFSLSDYELEKSKWKSPHEDIFNFSPVETFEWFDTIVDINEEDSECTNVHQALISCNTTVNECYKTVERAEVQIQQFVKYLLNIVAKPSEGEKSRFLIEVSDDNIERLKNFVKNGKSTRNSAIYDVLTEIIKYPRTSFVNRASSVLEVIASPMSYVLRSITNIFSTRTGEFSDIVSKCSLFLPLTTLIACLWKGHSLKRSIIVAFVVIMFLSYVEQLQQANQAAEAKRMANQMRRNDMPPECDPGSMSLMNRFYSGFKSLFWNSDKICEDYLREHFSEPPVEPHRIFMKTVLAALDELMGAIGGGLKIFFKNFGSYGISSVYMIPAGIVCLLGILALALMAFSGGSYSIPYLGRLSIGSSSPAWRTEEPQRLSPQQSPKVSSVQAGGDVIYNYTHHYYASVPPAALDGTNRQFLRTYSDGTIESVTVPEPNAAVTGTSQQSTSSIKPFPETAQSSTSAPSKASHRMQKRSGNWSDSGNPMEVGSGDVITPNLHRMLSIGVTPDRLVTEKDGLRHRHVRKNSLPNNFYLR